VKGAPLLVNVLASWLLQNPAVSEETVESLAGHGENEEAILPHATTPLESSCQGKPQRQWPGTANANRYKLCRVDNLQSESRAA